MFAKMFSRRLWTKDFILVLLVCSIASYTNSIFISLLPVYVLDLGGTNALTGMMMTGLTVLGMATRVVVAPLIDRIGRKKLLVIGSGLYALNALAFCFTKDLNVLFALRVLHGFTQGIFFPVPPTMVADIAPEDLLVDAMGFFGISSSLVFAVTPTIGLAIYNNWGPEAMFWSAVVTGIISFALSLPIKEHYQRPTQSENKPKQKAGFHLDKVFLTLVLLPSFISLFIYVGNAAVMSFLTPCGLERGIEQISLYFLMNNLAVIVSRLTVGRVITFIPKRTCILFGIILCGVGTGLIAVAYNLALMMLSAVLVGIGITAVTQLLQVEVLVAVPSQQRGLANTAFMLMGDIGNGAGAAIWGAVSAGAGYVPTYALAGASTLIGCVFHDVYWKKRK